MHAVYIILRDLSSVAERRVVYLKVGSSNLPGRASIQLGGRVSTSLITMHSLIVTGSWN